MNKSPDLAVQAGVQLETLAQTHLFGQGHDQVSVVSVGQFFGQGMA